MTGANVHDFNLVILGMLVGGICCIGIAYRLNSKSSFEDGSFMLQMVLIIVGGGLLVVGLVWKLILSLLY